MKPDALLDGHIVQGHVDQTAVCTAREDADGSWYYTFAYEPQGRWALYRGEGVGDGQRREPDGLRLEGVVVPRGDHSLYVRAYEFLPHRRGFGREPRIRHRGQVHCPPHAKLYEVSLMVYIKTKEGASLWIALLATAIVAGTMTLLDAVWWVTLCVCGAVFVVVALVALFIIRKYVAYKLKPIYSIVLCVTCIRTRDFFRAEGQACREYRRGTHGVGGYERQGDRPPQRRPSSSASSTWAMWRTNSRPRSSIYKGISRHCSTAAWRTSSSTANTSSGPRRASTA